MYLGCISLSACLPIYLHVLMCVKEKKRSCIREERHRESLEWKKGKGSEVIIFNKCQKIFCYQNKKKKMLSVTFKSNNIWILKIAFWRRTTLLLFFKNRAHVYAKPVFWGLGKGPYILLPLRSWLDLWSCYTSICGPHMTGKALEARAKQRGWGRDWQIARWVKEPVAKPDSCSLSPRNPHSRTPITALSSDLLHQPPPPRYISKT